MKAILFGAWAYFLLATLLLGALVLSFAGIANLPIAGNTVLLISSAVAAWLGTWSYRIHNNRARMTIHYLVASALSVVLVGVALYDNYVGVALFMGPFLFVAYGWEAARNASG